MWCDFCKKTVDINSVAVSSPKRAYSMDLEGDITPTVITSSNPQVINVCRSCGKSDYLFVDQAEVKKYKKNVRRMKRIAIKQWLDL